MALWNRSSRTCVRIARSISVRPFGAVSIPWAQAVNEADATFKSPEELRALYESKGINPDEEVIAYCRIGERSSLTWFVLKYLLGYPKVKNYDGSWTEWGNLVDAPIEK